MQFISPRTDYAFKKIFGSENSKKTCISFLNAILAFSGTSREIIDLEILDPWSAPKIKGLKDTFLDVKVKTIKGEYIIVEMQVLNVKGFKQRILYNTSKMYANQILSGEDYPKLNPVIALTIVDFDLIKESEKYINTFLLKEKAENFEYSQDFLLYFLELPKFKKNLEELKTVQDKWIYFLKEVDDFRTIPDVYKDKEFEEAFEIAETSHMSAEELEILEHQRMAIADKKGALELALETGEKKGEKKAKLEIAKNLLSKNIDISVIVASTGLTKNEIFKII